MGEAIILVIILHVEVYHAPGDALMLCFYCVVLGYSTSQVSCLVLFFCVLQNPRIHMNLDWKRTIQFYILCSYFYTTLSSCFVYAYNNPLFCGVTINTNYLAAL